MYHKYNRGGIFYSAPLFLAYMAAFHLNDLPHFIILCLCSHKNFAAIRHVEQTTWYNRFCSRAVYILFCFQGRFIVQHNGFTSFIVSFCSTFVIISYIFCYVNSFLKKCHVNEEFFFEENRRDVILSDFSLD